MSSSLTIGLFGATGRMGITLQQLASQTGNIHLIPLTKEEESPTRAPLKEEEGIKKKFIETLSLPYLAQQQLLPQVLIDFSHPEAVERHLQLALAYHLPLLIGTTGLSTQTEQNIQEAASLIPILKAANTSLGMTILTFLAEKAATLLGTDFNVEICEVHHRHKKDAPSGTALELGQAICKAQNRPFLPSFQRQGERPIEVIGYAVMRGGSVTGEHSVHFLGEEESITLQHRGFSRTLFARGALKAASWLATQPPGLYAMKDFLSHRLSEKTTIDK